MGITVAEADAMKKLQKLTWNTAFTNTLVNRAIKDTEFEGLENICQTQRICFQL